MISNKNFLKLILLNLAISYNFGMEIKPDNVKYKNNSGINIKKQHQNNKLPLNINEISAVKFNFNLNLTNEEMKEESKQIQHSLIQKIKNQFQPLLGNNGNGFLTILNPNGPLANKLPGE